MAVSSDASRKKIDVIDLTMESSSDEEEDPPAKRKCIFMAPSVTSADPAAIPPSLSGYSVPFHHTPVPSMSSDL
ncbi:hypothetical protein U0070_017388, partial [Myodes glareolus]